MKNIEDSTLVKFVREGENILARIRQDRTLRRVLGVGFLALASLLFIPPWFLIPGLVFAGFSLLGFRPFRFGACNARRRAPSGATEGSGEERAVVTSERSPHLRRWLLLTLAFVFVFGALHHVDHVVRGNHVGWPATAEVNPFTYSLMAYPLFALGLAAMTRGRVWAGYWFVYGLLALALVGTTHFIPPFIAEPVGDIYGPYLNPGATSMYPPAPETHQAWFQRTVEPFAGPLLAFVAVAVLVSSMVSAVMLVVVSVRVRRIQGHW